MFWNLVHRWKSQRCPIVHLFMLALLALYTLFGAICFCAFEAVNEREKLDRWASENEQKKLMARNRLLSDMQYVLVRNVNVSQLLSPEFQRTLDSYDKVMEFDGTRIEGKRARAVQPKWTIWGGLYFAGTIYTTIGYGDIVVETVAGKLFTVLYALLGIPLVIIALNMWGGGLYRLTIIIWHNHIRRLLRSLPSLGEKSDGKANGELLKNGAAAGLQVVVDGIGSKEQPEGGDNATAGLLMNGGIDKKPRLPLKSALLLLLAWIVFCALLFTFFQDWSFLNAAYFFFISLTTIGLGDHTVEHKVACAYFLLILFGLTVVSMCFNIIQLKLETVFAKIIHSIDADFKNMLTAEKQKHSMGTSTVMPAEMMQQQQQQQKGVVPSIQIIDIAGQQQPLQQKMSLVAQQQQQQPEPEVNALLKYRGTMSRGEQWLAQILMSQQQKRLLNEKLRTRRRMKNAGSQTDDKAVDAQAQTELLNNLRPISSLFRHQSAEEQTDSDEEEEDVPSTPTFIMPIAFGSHRRANTYGGGGTLSAGGSKGAGGGGGGHGGSMRRGKGLSRKKLYIYNTGD